MNKIIFLCAFLLLISCIKGPEIKDGMLFGSFSGNSSHKLTIKFDRGETFTHNKKFGFIQYRITPQLAIWVEDTAGNYLSTVYVTRCFGKQEWKFVKPHPDSCFRSMCMPYWLNRFITAGNSAPTAGKPLPDALTGATPSGGFSVQLSIPDSLNTIKLFTEWNSSFDSNSNFPDFNGQPSIVACVKIDFLDSINNADTLKVIGRGGVTGNDKTLYSDVEKLTTALSIFGNIVAIRKSNM